MIRKCQLQFINEIQVPNEEQDFLIDQRGVRKMFIGSIDLPTSKRLQKNVARKSKSLTTKHQTMTNNKISNARKSRTTPETITSQPASSAIALNDFSNSIMKIER
jgi:hypothetical protein